MYSNVIVSLSKVSFFFFFLKLHSTFTTLDIYIY